MDSFRIQGRVIADYRAYIESFANIRDEELRAVVEESLSEGRLWPEPLIQFNPSYRITGDLAPDRADPECDTCKGKVPGGGFDLNRPDYTYGTRSKFQG